MGDRGIRHEQCRMLQEPGIPTALDQESPVEWSPAERRGNERVGPGWWQASDGRRYPPEVPPESKQPPERSRRHRRRQLALEIGVGVLAVTIGAALVQVLTESPANSPDASTKSDLVNSAIALKGLFAQDGSGPGSRSPG